MTNPTPHGQVPEALIDLIDAYAETRHRCGGIYNARTEAALNAVIEALSRVQALSAAPGVTSEQRRLIGVIADKIEDGTLFQSGIYPKKDLARFVRNMLDTTPTAPAASPTPPAEQQAQPDECFPGEPKVAVPQGLIGAACFVIRNKRDGGKVLEQLRRYSVGDRSQPLTPQQAAPKAAPGELSADSLRHQNKLLAETLGACILASGIVRKDIDGFTGPELLHFGEDLRSMLDVAPKQEVQEPCGWTTGITWRPDTRLQSEQVIKITRDTQPKYGYTTPIYTAPQPAPLSDDVVKDAARWRMAVLIGNEVMMHPDKRTHATAVKAYMLATYSGLDMTGAVDAALAAQGGKV